MSFFTKAIHAATQTLRKAPLPDPGTTIRSALKAAGLSPDITMPPSGLDPLGCMAPPGAATILGGLMRGRRGPMPSRPEEDSQPSAAAQGRFAWRAIVGPWGTRRYKLFVPESSEPPAGLIVMLHGCSQNPDDFAAGTRMNAVAAEHNLLVAYPEQVRSANVSLCWNWFDAAHQRRGAGEPALIAAITRAVVAEHGVPAGRTFVAGLSAGGAMAAVMAHTDGELFVAVGIHSGLPYLAASDVPSAFAAMRGDPAAPVVAAGAAFASVPAIIFHGDADRTVNVSNAEAIVARLAEAGRHPTVERGKAPDGSGYVRTVGRNAAGAVRFEDWRLVGAGHAWSGGSRAGSYAEPGGPDASREMVRFFLEQARRSTSAILPGPILLPPATDAGRQAE